MDKKKKWLVILIFGSVALALIFQLIKFIIAYRSNLHYEVNEPLIITEINGLQLLQYYYTYFLHEWFMGYPWMVRISNMIILLSILFIIILVINLLQHFYYKKRLNRKYNQLQDKYFKKIEDICLSSENITSDEIKKILSYEIPAKTNNIEYKAWILFLINLKYSISASESYSSENFNQTLKAINFNSIVENRFESTDSSMDKYYLLQIIMLLNVKLNDSMLLRFKTERNRSLRKLTHIYSMIFNPEDPYMSLSHKDADFNLTKWDKIELHHYLTEIKKAGHVMPSFTGILQNVKDTDLEPFFIQEIAYLGTDDEMRYLFSYFNSGEEECRIASFKSMAIRRFSEAEQPLVRCYDNQIEELKRIIIKTLYTINTGKSLIFFREAYINAASENTQRIILRCMFLYSEEGRRMFEDIKSGAAKDKLYLFEHVRDPIINMNMDVDL